PAYSFLVRRNYMFLGVIFAGAFGFEMAFDTISDRIWDNLNKGRQWKDIRAKYIQSEDDE
ncbi:ubiquinol-cytochrome C reductase, partial [Acephala macrosclerotiorum]